MRLAMAAILFFVIFGLVGRMDMEAEKQRVEEDKALVYDCTTQGNFKCSPHYPIDCDTYCREWLSQNGR